MLLHAFLCPPCTDLWYYGDSGAELMEAQLSNVNAINEDVALCCLDDPEHPQCQG